MLNESVSVPFRLPEIYHGLAEGQGVLRFHSDGLQLEFAVNDSFLGTFKSDIKIVVIPVAELAEVAVIQGWIRTRLTIRAKSLKTLQEIPGTEGAMLVLKIRRKDRSLATELVSAVNLQICMRDVAKLRDHLEHQSGVQ